MKRFLLVLTVIAVGLFAAPLPGAKVEATHPPSPQPLLGCADVTGDGPVDISDIRRVVSKFGTYDPTFTATATYHPLYDLRISDTGAIDIGDIRVAVSDFGLVCGAIAPVNTQIAQATLAALALDDAPTANCPANWNILIENATCLSDIGYLRGAQDLPGHGIHYVNPSLLDAFFDPAQPDGLAYHNGRLVSHVYYADGDAVGWGGMPPHSNGVNIDAFCTPVPPNTACSFSGSEDGWHDHVSLCIWNLGTPSAFVLAPVSQANCESTGGIWDPRNGWMLHSHNHTLNLNGRFANCFPDVEHWKAYNCPQ